jgi:hypothetical protein
MTAVMAILFARDDGWCCQVSQYSDVRIGVKGQSSAGLVRAQQGVLPFLKG